MTDDLVLVTGGSGFVGSHCLVALLNEGYRVRTTLRSLDRAEEVRAMVRAGGAEPGERLTFAAADLTRDAGWPEAVAGCRYVLHVASPFPLAVPKDEDELIVPARDGALRVLKAAHAAGVQRVVLTSSYAAIGYGHAPTDRAFTEADWTDLSGARPVDPYPKSKTIAERAAWDHVAEHGGPELAVVNPVGILGPLLGPDASTSIELVRRLVDGEMPGMPKLSFGIVDVRDVADLHLRAMVDPKAAGERFLAISGDFLTIKQMADILRAGLGDRAPQVPTRVLPNWVVRTVALFDSGVRQLLPELGHSRHATAAKAHEVLGWSPRTPDEAILASAESLLAMRA